MTKVKERGLGALGLALGLLAAACSSPPDEPEARGGKDRSKEDAGASLDAGAQSDGGEDDDDRVTVSSGDGGGVVVPIPDAGHDGGATPAPVTLRGHLRVGERLYIDQDVANLDVLPGVNDHMNRADPDMDEAQVISSPSTVVGYLGPEVPTGEEGETRPDDVDYYKVQLQQGQIVSLYVSEPGAEEAPRPDLDLFLFPALADGEAELAEPDDFVDDDQGVGDKELVVAPVTGTYWVAVERYQDDQDDGSPEDDAKVGGVYTLTVGVRPSDDVLSEMASSKVSSSLALVPGTALVEMNPGSRVPEVTRSGRRFSLSRGPVGRFQRVDVALPSARRIERSARSERVARQATISAIKELSRQRGVLRVHPEYLYSTQQVPDDPLYPQQWHYSQLDLEEAWANSDRIENGSRGEGVVVAVIDTGIVPQHPDFENADGSSQIVAGKDVISFYGQTRSGEELPDFAVDGDGVDNDPTDPGDGRTPGDHSFHGTHCAGTIAAATNNGKGGAGVAPNAKIMPVRAIGRGGGISSDIAVAILWAAGLDNPTGTVPKRPADIISMSLGGPRSTVFADAVAAARAKGVIVVAAAGNEHADVNLVGPAAEPGVVAVSATDFNRDLAFYSNSGGAVDVAAPGGDIQADINLDGLGDGVISTVFKNNGRTQYIAYQGTSMATPHVAGVAALMKSIWPAMTPDDFDRVLPEIAIDIGNMGKDPSFGHGLINANRAVLVAAREASKTITSEPVLSVSTTALDFGGGDNDRLPLVISNTGDEAAELQLTAVTPSAAWISVPGADVGLNEVVIDRQHPDLQPGANLSSVLLQSNGGDVSIDVRVFVGDEPLGGDLDLVYVLLVNPETGKVRDLERDQVAAFRSEEGFLPDYGFEFEAVAPGRYYLVAGTDAADTFFLGNDGDAYGAFPLAQDPEMLCINVEDEVGNCKRIITDDTHDMDFALQVLVDQGAEYVEDANAGVSSKGVSGRVRAIKAERAW